MKRVYSIAVPICAFLLHTASAHASSFTIDFCPGAASCPAGVTEASLTFTENPSADPNDYTLDLIIAGSASAPKYVNQVSFSIDGVSTPDGYDSSAPPSLNSSPGTGLPWVVFFDNISGNAASCTSNTDSSQSVCAQSGPGDSTNHGAILPGKVLDWQFNVNLADGEDPLGIGSSVNLRAQFLNSDGKNAGILSPDGGSLQSGCSANVASCDVDITSVPVPEPVSIVLFGTGLLGVGARRWRNRGRRS